MNKWLILIGISAMLCACGKGHELDCVKGTGDIVIRSYDIYEPFTTIELHDRGDVVLVEAPYYKVEVKAGEKLQAGLTPRVNGNTLKLEDENKCKWSRSYSKEITYTIYSPNLLAFNHKGIGTVRCADTLHYDSTHYHTYFGGNFDLNVHSQFIKVSQAENGNVTLRGYTENLEVQNYKFGILEAYDLIAEHGYIIQNRGSEGDVKVQVIQTMYVFLGGPGHVYTKGSPTTQTVKESSGNLYFVP